MHLKRIEHLPAIDTQMDKVRIMIAEDHALFRQGLRSLIESMGTDFEICGEMEDGRQAVEGALSLKPDLVLTDLCMPNLNGTEAIRAIKQRLEHVKIIVITAHRAEEYVRLSLDAGADGYVLKEDTHQDVLQAIRAVLQGKTFLSPGVCGTVVSRYLNKPATEPSTSSLDKLTNRERQVLKLVAEGRTNRDIAGYLSISVKTVEKHRTSLMKKLNVHNVAEVTTYAINHNFIDSD